MHHHSKERKLSNTFRDDHQFVVSQQEKAELAILDANCAAGEESNDVEIRDIPASYAVVGVAESNDKITQDVSGETAESDVFGKQTSALSCDDTYDLPPDCKLLEEQPTMDSRHRALRDDKATTRSQTDKTHKLVPHEDHIYTAVDKPLKMSSSTGVPPSAQSGVIGQQTSALYMSCDDTYDLQPDCKLPEEEPTMDSRHRALKAATATARSLTDTTHKLVPHEDHIYTAVDKSHKMSSLAGVPPSASLMHSTDATYVYSEVDMARVEDWKSSSMGTLEDDFQGDPGNVGGDAEAESGNTTSHSTAKGAVPTDEAAMVYSYVQVDFSQMKPKKCKK